MNPTTGAYHILKIASAYDVGKAINPELIRGQCIGGMVQGLGTALCEGYIYDQQGHLLNPSFTDNKIPTSKDLPDEIECIIVETGAGRRALRRARRGRASDDLGRSRARQRDQERDRRGADAHADPQRGRLAGDEQQGAGRDLDHQDPRRAPAGRSLWTGRTPPAAAAAAPVRSAGTTAAVSFLENQEGLTVSGAAPRRRRGLSASMRQAR